MDEPKEQQEPGQQTEYEQQKKRRMRELLGMATTGIAERATPGERVLPLLYAAMETCWVDAILIGLATLELFHTQTPLMPLWAPFVLIAGSRLLYSILERRQAQRATEQAGEEENGDEQAAGMLPGTSLFVTVLALVILVLIWASLYAGSWFLLDPRWLLSMVNDVLLLDGQAYHIITIVAISIFLCWRGIRLAQRELQPTSIFKTLQSGMLLITGIILLQAAVASSGIAPDLGNTVALLLLIPLFLFFSLAAHALARVTFVRHTPPTGLEGNPATQERAIISIVSVIGIGLLLIAVFVNSFASPAFLAQTQQALSWVGAVYNWLVNIIAAVLAFLLTPIFWLFSLWFAHHPESPPEINQPGNNVKHIIKGAPPQTYPAAILIFAKIIVPVLILALIVLLLWLALRRRRVRIERHSGPDETRESLWSWSLFWTQVRSLLLALLRRFFPRKEVEAQESRMEPLQGEPAARSIREIYRLLLRWAASRGYARHRDETPYEFRQRLSERIGASEPQLEIITEAYTATRYGGHIPDDSEVARVRQQWLELEQKTRISS